jgi:hydrogenase maturation protease
MAVLLIGIGNEYRGDDGAGLAAIRSIKARDLSGTLCVESTGDGVSLMETWSASDVVILIDAVSSGARPGTIYRFDALTQSIPLCFSMHSTHAFGLAEAIELARTLGRLPRSLIVYAIEGKSFIAGTGLSPEVEQAVPEAVEQVTGEIQVYRTLYRGEATGASIHVPQPPPL